MAVKTWKQFLAEMEEMLPSEPGGAEQAASELAKKYPDDLRQALRLLTRGGHLDDNPAFKEKVDDLANKLSSIDIKGGEDGPIRNEPPEDDHNNTVTMPSADRAGGDGGGGGGGE